MAVKNGGDGMRKGNGGQDDEDRARLVKKRSPNEEVNMRTGNCNFQVEA